MNYWKSKTIYRKIILILTAVHLLGCFVFPIATLRRGSSSLNQWMSMLGMEELPEKLSLFGLIRILDSAGGSDGIFFSLVIIANVIILAIQLIGKKRASYVITLIIWGIFSMFEFPAMESAESMRIYESSTGGVFLILVAVAISIVAILGIIMEMKAQSKMLMKASMPKAEPAGDGEGAKTSFKIDPEKMERMKEQAGNIADTSAAVAKKAAKAAVKGIYKATDAVKGFVEDAKNESGVGTSAAPAQQAPIQQAPVQQMQNVQQAPVQQPPQNVRPSTSADFDDMKTVAISQESPRVQIAEEAPRVIPQTGTITGIIGMFSGAQIPLENGEELIIGRAADSCNIILEGAVISRKHCVVVYDGSTGNYLVTDYSENGTFVGNGGRLPSKKQLSLVPGTIICIGNDENAFKLG